MPLQLLFGLAIASMAILAVSRVVRVHLGRTPFPDVRGRSLFVLAFLIGPPIVVGALTAGGGAIGGFTSVPIYLVLVGAVATVMAIGALLANYLAPGRSRPILLVALIGREADPYDIPVDPPMTKSLTDGVADVDRANAVFPRGGEFLAQVDRTGFRQDWEALDAATRTLERRIDADRGLGIAVAARAKATAADARSRLTTLRSHARGSGQTWAS